VLAAVAGLGFLAIGWTHFLAANRYPLGGKTLSVSLLEHDLLGKPVPTFPDHAPI